MKLFRPIQSRRGPRGRKKAGDPVADIPLVYNRDFFSGYPYEPFHLFRTVGFARPQGFIESVHRVVVLQPPQRAPPQMLGHGRYFLLSVKPRNHGGPKLVCDEAAFEERYTF